MSRDCVIYKIINSKTNQIYIGSSVNIKQRINRHFKDLRNDKHHSLKMQRSYNKYGKDVFIVEFLITIPEEYRQKIEQWFLDNNDCYYNNEKIVGKPSCSRVFSEKERNEKREKMKGNTYYKLNLPQSEERKLKSANTCKNRVWTQDMRDKLSNSKIGNLSRKGIPHTQDTKNKMSLNSHNKREIAQYNLNGIYIRDWESIALIVKELHINNSSIVSCCKGTTKKSGGFMWRYKTVDFENNIEPLKDYVKYDHNEILYFYNSGKSRTEIMEKFKISSTGLHYILSKHKLI